MRKVSSLVDLTASNLSISTAEALLLRQARDGKSCKSELAPDLQYLAYFQEHNTTVVRPFESDLFSQLIRSCSPNLAPNTVINNRNCQTVTDVDDPLTSITTHGVLHHNLASKDNPRRL